MKNVTLLWKQFRVFAEWMPISNQPRTMWHDPVPTDSFIYLFIYSINPSAFLLHLLRARQLTKHDGKSKDGSCIFFRRVKMTRTQRKVI